MRFLFEVFAVFVQASFFLKGLFTLGGIKIGPEKRELLGRLELRIRDEFQIKFEKPSFIAFTILKGLSGSASCYGAFRFAGLSSPLQEGAVVSDFDDIVRESLFMYPGCKLRSKGYLPCGSTGCGDVFCLDSNHTDEDGWSRVVLFSHDDDFSKQTKERVEKVAKEVASNYLEFVKKFLDETLHTEAMSLED